VLADSVPPGHRRHQLAHAVDLLEPPEGRLLDLGAGSGWLSGAWPGPVVAVDVFAPSTPVAPWVVGSTASLPFAAASFDVVALLASLGAFRHHGELVAALGEVARVVRPGGRVVALASARRRVLDLLAPHRVRTGWQWRSFPPDELRAAFETVGFAVDSTERQGGVRSLAVDWAVTLGGPVLRRTGGERALERIGEADRSEFAAPSAHGRYISIRATRLP
jgi:SAM-dependent methyltransferase